MIASAGNELFAVGRPGKRYNCRAVPDQGGAKQLGPRVEKPDRAAFIAGREETIIGTNSKRQDGASVADGVNISLGAGY